MILKNCVLFTNCISEIKNTQVDNVKDLDVVMPVYNLTEYSDNYFRSNQKRLWVALKASGPVREFSVWELDYFWVGLGSFM